MQVQSVSVNNIGFTSNNREVFDVVGNSKVLRYRNSTCFFREDLDWHRLADNLIKKYENCDKVNVYSYGCSEGAEPFSLAMILIQKLGFQKAQKFFPIHASDIDAEILKNPKNGKVLISEDDIYNLKKNLGDSYKNFIKTENNYSLNKEFGDNVKEGFVSDVLKKSVEFKQSGIAEDLQNIKKDNSVVLCRNFWSYIKNYSEQTSLVKKLFNHLENNSMCLTGDFDYDAENLFREVGFKSGGQNHCYIKEDVEKCQKKSFSPKTLFEYFARHDKK